MLLKPITPFNVPYSPPKTVGSDDAFDSLYEVTAVKESYADKIEIRGGRGIDRLGVDAFALQADVQLEVASKKALEGSYRFAPYLEKLITRGARRLPRRISVPTLRDRVVLQQLKLFLQEPFASSLERRLPNEFIREIRAFAAGRDLAKYGVLRTDISSFYDRVDHDILLCKVRARVRSRRAMDLIRRAIRNPTVPSLTTRAKRKGQRNPRGVPQGLAISNLLAAVYLEELDTSLRASSVCYLRYVDDLFVAAPLSEIADVEKLLKGKLKSLGLEMNVEKTTNGPSLERFEYLGYRFDLPRVSIKQESVERFLRTVAARFSAYQHRSRTNTHPGWMNPQERRQAFIDDLNEKITGAISEANRYGWLFYYSEIDDLALLHKLDAVIGKMFRRLSEFKGQPLGGVKRLSRAIFEIKYSPTGGYIHNYNALTTPRQFLDYLIRRGILDPANASQLSVDQVTEIFTRERERRLLALERDVGVLY